MVTSRIRLQVGSEHEHQVPALSLPRRKPPPSAEQLTQYDAVCLFIERAAALKPDFQITNENAPAVAEICHKLDGLPLAIELAAARIKILPPQAMLARLESRLKTVSGGRRDLPARQQTLRGAIEWSYDLLDDGEKQLFRRLAVFQGGRTLEAIEVVCNAEGDLLVDVLDGIESLVDNSLLRQDEGVGSEPRFVMLETIHEYAQEKLEECGEAEELRRHHARYFLRLAEEVEPKLRGPEQKLWFDRLEEEQDNIRAVFQWCQRAESGAEDVEIGLRLAGAMFWYWYSRGPYAENRQRVAGVLSRAAAMEWMEPAKAVEATGATALKAARARALRTAGVLASVQGDNQSAQTYWEEGLGLAREVGDRQLEGSMLNNLANIAHEAEGDYEPARSLYEQSLAIHRELGNKHNIVIQLNNLGGIDRDEGDFATARIRHEEAMAIARELGDKNGIALSLQCLGELAYREGDYPLAYSLHNRALAILGEIGYKGWSIPWSLRDMGYAALRQGDYDRAAALFRESITFSLEHGITRFIFLSIAGLAGVAGAQGGSERAAKLFGASEAMLEAAGIKELERDVKAEVDRDVAAARAQLDEEAWAKAWEEGRAMSMEEAIEYALQES
jgi:predicted ATPase